MRAALISLVILVIGFGDSLGQDEGPVTSHERAAAELIDLLQLERISTTTVDVMAEAMISQNPMAVELMDMVAEFTEEFVRWEDLRPEYIRIYRDAYTEAELIELIAFYKTPVGRKTVEITPELVKQSTDVRQKLMQQHLPELQRRIRVRVRPDGGT